MYNCFFHICLIQEIFTVSIEMGAILVWAMTSFLFLYCLSWNWIVWYQNQFIFQRSGKFLLCLKFFVFVLGKLGKSWNGFNLPAITIFLIGLFIMRCQHFIPVDFGWYILQLLKVLSEDFLFLFQQVNIGAWWVCWFCVCICVQVVCLCFSQVCVSLCDCVFGVSVLLMFVCEGWYRCVCLCVCVWICLLVSFYGNAPVHMNL